MSKIIRLNDSPIRCPLCHEFLEKSYDDARRVFILHCRKDNVGIRCDDPLAGRWEEARSRVDPADLECPNCNAAMRFFATSVGHMKMVCPKKTCRAAMEFKEVDRETVDTPGEGTKGLIQ